MPQHDTAYAMTIHKSQGSEFDSVIVVLPEEDSPLLSRELLYTAVTRAKKNIVVVASESILATCVSRKAVRQSGLRGALWPEQTPPADVTFGNEPVVAAESMVEDKTAERAVEEASDVSLSETPVAVSEPGIAELAISESVATEPVIAEQFALDSADAPRQKKRKKASRKAPQASDKPTPVQGSFDF
jgi:ATP-dependent exoDNAse (exonuclease V) beta subunit